MRFINCWQSFQNTSELIWTLLDCTVFFSNRKKRTARGFPSSVRKCHAISRTDFHWGRFWKCFFTFSSCWLVSALFFFDDELMTRNYGDARYGFFLSDAFVNVCVCVCVCVCFQFFSIFLYFFRSCRTFTSPLPSGGPAIRLRVST